jgi:hypothetical protein
MPTNLLAPDADFETLAAQLASAAYRVVLEGGLRAPFIDIELGLWRELRNALRGAPAGALSRLAEVA